MRKTVVQLTAFSVLSLAIGLNPGLAVSQQLYRIFDLAPGEQWTTVESINAKGQVAGTANYILGIEPEEPYIWFRGQRTKLGTLGGETMRVRDINGAGQVTGYGRSGDIFSSEHAFLWDGLVMHDLVSSGNERSEGLDVNSKGQVTGQLTNSAGFGRAFIWDGVSIQELETLGGEHSEGAAINGRGHVVGRSDTVAGFSRAFLWDGTKMKDLGTLGGNSSWATGLNNLDQVIGDSVTTSGEIHAFLWDGTTMKDLGTFGDDSSAVAINAAGQVTGWSSTPSGAVHPFLWDGSTLRDLGSLVGGHGFPQAINSAGQVVGSSRMRGNESRAFLSNGGNPMVDLNALIDRSDPLVDCIDLRVGFDINNRGQIAASGDDKCVSTYRHGSFLVSPMDYMLVLNSPRSDSSWPRTGSISIKLALVDAVGVRISDARAASLITAPCRVKFSATGAQSRSAVCMKYDPVKNEFFFDWKPGASANTGATTLKVAATYDFSMPETITTFKTRSITITQ